MQFQIEYITREQDENRSNTSKIGQTTHSNKNNDNDSNGIIHLDGKRQIWPSFRICIFIGEI